MRTGDLFSSLRIPVLSVDPDEHCSAMEVTVLKPTLCLVKSTVLSCSAPQLVPSWPGILKKNFRKEEPSQLCFPRSTRA